jgi:hypothetical protein
MTLITAAAALVLAGGVANASTLSGLVKSVNPHNRTIALWDGMTFKLTRSVNMSQIAPNGLFDITYNDEHGRNVATSVKPTSPWPRW